MSRPLLIAICVLLCYLTGMTDAMAQVKYSRAQKELMKEADYYFSYGDYVGAQNIYDSLYQIDSASPDLNFKLGICELITNDDNSISAKYFKTASDAGHTEAHFSLGNWYHLQHEFDKAIEMYEKYNSVDKKKSIDDSEVEHRIATSKRAKDMINKPVEVRIENMGEQINTKFPEYVPVVSADESILIFTSRRKGSTGGKLDPYGGYFEDIYISYKENGEWLPPESIGANINTDNYDACVGLSADGSSLITYKTNESYTGGDLYLSTSVDGVWQKPVKYGQNINSKYLEPSATLAFDGNTLYFSSNRPGGYGGLDIYRVVQFANGEWSLPLNLGPMINTKYDDDAPFIHPDNVTLYFSSQGHTTIGGYDIFKAELYDNGTWGKPKNLGYPINTTDDDMYFVLSADGRRGYYASGALGGYGNQDLYIIHMPYEFRQYTIVRGIIMSADSMETPLTAKITLTEYDSNEIKAIYNTSSRTGKYLIIVPPDKKFNMSVEAKGYKTLRKIIHYEAGNFAQYYKPIRLERNQE